MQLDGSQVEPRGIGLDWRIFYWSIHFHSKFGGVKHPDRSKSTAHSSPETVQLLFLSRGEFEQRTSNMSRWSRVHLLTEQVFLIQMNICEREPKSILSGLFLWPFCHLGIAKWHRCHSVYIGTRNTASLLYPLAMISGLTRIKGSWKRSCLCHWMGAVTVLLTATAS